MSAFRDTAGDEYQTVAEWMVEVERRAHELHPDRFTRSVRNIIEHALASAEEPTSDRS